MGSLQKKRMLCTVGLLLLLHKSSFSYDIKTQACRNFINMINICKNELEDCKEAATLKASIADKKSAESLSLICYYVCLSEKTGYKKKEVESAVKEFLDKEGCKQ